MWSAVWTYVVPGAIALFALFDLITGEMNGWRSRKVRGAKARVLSVLLLLTTAAALAVGPMIPIDLGLHRGEREALVKQRDLEQSIREARREELKWAAENRPPLGAGVPDDPQKSRELLKKLEDFNVDRKRRAEEADRRVAGLESQLESARQDHATAAAARDQAARRNGVWVASLVGLVLVRSLAWLAGRREDDETPPSQPLPPDAAQGPQDQQEHRQG